MPAGSSEFYPVPSTSHPALSASDQEVESLVNSVGAPLQPIQCRLDLIVIDHR